MQEAEEDGHHRRLGPLCQDQAVGLKGEENREEKKTTIKNANLNPYYNESFVFVVEEMSLRKVKLSLFPTHI